MMEMFEKWCALNGEKTHHASPAIVARFVKDIAPMGISKVWRAVQDISRTHSVIGLADPTLGGPVAVAMNEISKIAPPRSWPKEEQLQFSALPYDIQVTIEKRERDRDNQVRTLQNEFAKLRRN
ncbi:hypothetical protein [Bradyrhizobium sp. Bra78]|uniref:hypothetical protein n=1 Tax=Bradyrhizobium sp. Bra78 TaxID=2926010 RepID=UPI0021C8CBAB|nr:hypothetical protein [Bradyrhizobium sp. Bra78]